MLPFPLPPLPLDLILRQVLPFVDVPVETVVVEGEPEAPPSGVVLPFAVDALRFIPPRNMLNLSRRATGKTDKSGRNTLRRWSLFGLASFDLSRT